MQHIESGQRYIRRQSHRRMGRYALVVLVRYETIVKLFHFRTVFILILLHSEQESTIQQKQDYNMETEVSLKVNILKIS